MQRLSFILSAQKDPDIAALRETIGEKEFASLTRNALRAIVRSDYRVQNPLPPGTILCRPAKDKVRVTISLSAKKDADVAKLLDYVTKRQVTHFVKEAIRLHVGTILLQAFMNEDFMGALSNNTHATIHVFQMGASISAPVSSRPTTKPKKPRKVSKRQEASSVALNPVPSAPIPTTAIEERTELTIPKFELNNDMTATNSDDDDVLAMLSAMLS